MSYVAVLNELIMDHTDYEVPSSLRPLYLETDVVTLDMIKNYCLEVVLISSDFTDYVRSIYMINRTLAKYGIPRAFVQIDKSKVVWKAIQTAE